MIFVRKLVETIYGASFTLFSTPGSVGGRLNGGVARQHQAEDHENGQLNNIGMKSPGKEPLYYGT